MTTAVLQHPSSEIELDLQAETIARFATTRFGVDNNSSPQLSAFTCNTDLCEPSWDDCTGTLCATDFGC